MSALVIHSRSYPMLTMPYLPTRGYSDCVASSTVSLKASDGVSGGEDNSISLECTKYACNCKTHDHYGAKSSTGLQTI